MAQNNGGNDRSSAGSGMKFIQGFPRDNSSHGVGDQKANRTMGGSLTNLAHSLPGTTAQIRGAKGSGVNPTYKL